MGKGRFLCQFGPATWNSLPVHIRQSQCLVTFKKQLKAYLFTKHLSLSEREGGGGGERLGERGGEGGRGREKGGGEGRGSGGEGESARNK